MPRPVRTCVGCRAKAAKSDLLRLVAVVGDDGSAAVVVDRRQSAPGRGAYLHRRAECCTAALRRRALGRALRVSPPEPGQLWRAVEPHLSSVPASPRAPA